MKQITAFVRSISSVVQNGVTTFYLTLKPSIRPVPAHMASPDIYKPIFTAGEQDFQLIPILACLVPDQQIEVTYVSDEEPPLASCFDASLRYTIVDIKVA